MAGSKNCLIFQNLTCSVLLQTLPNFQSDFEIEFFIKRVKIKVSPFDERIKDQTATQVGKLHLRREEKLCALQNMQTFISRQLEFCSEDLKSEYMQTGMPACMCENKQPSLEKTRPRSPWHVGPLWDLTIGP